MFNVYVCVYGYAYSKLMIYIGNASKETGKHSSPTLN